ncbi:hypothetical protein [Marinithermus hydrothermalis]|uniref:Antitermination protein NusB n=1 Tax=Marinithermus hydrothermalis (strain DSM 14884 / JCM 11576 / T1) TaxID=869210 RepID=F2NP09_MARHT|nr:hypothetical protein [Marinithermus hydrothermalis]AEB11597.1 hypothetical protein Marky_0851 [Marinithermus hydrothermalis DSM 14884]
MDGSQSYWLLWLALAALNAFFAQKQGQPGWAWFALSLFLGPAVTLFLTSRKQKRNRV